MATVSMYSETDQLRVCWLWQFLAGMREHPFGLADDDKLSPAQAVVLPAALQCHMYNPYVTQVQQHTQLAGGAAATLVGTDTCGPAGAAAG